MESIALVTGADRGLGFALSKSLLNQGWHVIAGQFMPEWPDLNTLSAGYPGHLTVVAIDVNSLESVQAAAQRLSGVVDHLDLLINNAGVNPPPTGALYAKGWITPSCTTCMM
jgi:NAD(P)-dependent dehydrogenase (short-subunit alcohol dehydrogenase family)